MAGIKGLALGALCVYVCVLFLSWAEMALVRAEGSPVFFLPVHGFPSTLIQSPPPPPLPCTPPSSGRAGGFNEPHENVKL